VEVEVAAEDDEDDEEVIPCEMEVLFVLLCPLIN
jgi:hypothetical protein